MNTTPQRGRHVLVQSNTSPAAERRRLSPLAAKTLAIGGAVSVLATAIPVGLAATAATPEYVVNGGFDNGTNGWKTNTAAQSITAVSGGRTGQAASLGTSTTGDVVLNDAAATIPTTTSGKSYSVSAWVKTQTPGVSGQLRIREVSGSGVKTHSTPFKLGDSEWHEVKLSVTTTSSGGHLDLNVVGTSFATTSKLLVDDVSLTDASTSLATTSPAPTTASPAPTTSAPAPTTTSPAPTTSAPAPAPTTSSPAPAPTTSAPTTTAPSTATLTGTQTPEMGIPSKVLVGAAYGGNTDPSDFEQRIGGTLQIRRTFWRGDNVDSAVSTAAGDVAKGRIPWLSFKLPYTWSEMAAGKGDAWAKDLTQKLAALNAPVWVAFHHEPEGDGDVTQWVAMQRRLAPIVHANSNNVAFSTILTGWHQLYGDAKYSLDALYPGDGLVDIMGFDPYNEYGVVKDGKTITNPFNFGLSTLSAFAKSKKAAWGLAETALTDEASKVDPTWMDRTYSELSANGAIAMTYFNTELNAYGSWLINDPAKTQQFADILKRAEE